MSIICLFDYKPAMPIDHWAIVTFFSVLRHLNFQQYTSQQGKKTKKKKKVYGDILKLCLVIKISRIRQQ
jgi:hypothetical protein